MPLRLQQKKGVILYNKISVTAKSFSSNYFFYKKHTNTFIFKSRLLKFEDLVKQKTLLGKLKVQNWEMPDSLQKFACFLPQKI